MCCAVQQTKVETKLLQITLYRILNVKLMIRLLFLDITECGTIIKRSYNVTVPCEMVVWIFRVGSWLCQWQRKSIFLFRCNSPCCGWIVWDLMTKFKTKFVCSVHLRTRKIRRTPPFSRYSKWQEKSDAGWLPAHTSSTWKIFLTIFKIWISRRFSDCNQYSYSHKSNSRLQQLNKDFVIVF